MFNARDITAFKKDFLKDEAVYDMQNINVSFRQNTQIVLDGIESSSPTVTFRKQDVDDLGIEPGTEILIHDTTYTIRDLVTDDGYFVMRKVELTEV